MALPSSGVLEAYDIYREYYKTHTSQEINMNTIGGLYDFSNPISFDKFYDQSWTVIDIPSIVEPDLGTTTSSGWKTGNTLTDSIFPWTSTPNFDEHPGGAATITMEMISSVQITYDSGFVGTGSGSTRYSLDGGSSYTTCAYASGASGSGSHSDSDTRSFSITTAQISLFRIQIRYTMPEGTMSSCSGSIRLNPTAIVGGDNHVRANLSRDTIALDSGLYNAATDAYQAGLTFG